MTEEHDRLQPTDPTDSRWLWVALAVAVLLRVPSFTLAIWNLDEADIAAAADRILSGSVYYRDAFGHRGPLTPYLFAGVFAIAGRFNMIAIRVVLTLLIAFMTFLVWRLGLRIGGRAVAAASSLFFAVMASVSLPASDLFAFNTEWPMALGTLLGSLLLLQSLSGRASPALAAGSGCCYAVAFLSRQSSALDCVGVVLFALILAGRTVSRRDFAKLRKLISTFASVGLAFAAAVTGTAAFFWLAGAWGDTVFGFWTYNTQYYTAGLTFPDRLSATISGTWDFARTGGFGLFVVAGALCALTQKNQAAHHRRDQSSARLFVVIWSAFAFISTALTGRVHGHYYISVIAPWCLLSGLALGTLLRVRHVPPSRRGSVLRLTVPTAVVIVIVGILPSLAMMLPENLDRQRRWVVDPPTERLATYIQQTTGPSDSIFVWGFYPHLYALSGRSAAARYTSCTFITGANSGDKTVPGAMAGLMEDLERARPELIIDTAPGDYFRWGRYPLSGFPPLGEFVATWYEQDTQFRRADGAVLFEVYRLRNGELKQRTTVPTES